MKTNILLFSVSIGSGHDSAARALEQQLTEKIAGAKTKMIDTFDYINPTLHKVVLGSYIESLRFNPKVWGYLYRQAERGDRMVDLGQILNKLLSHKLHELIEEFCPDAIICTHAFPAGIISVLKAKTGLNIPVVVVLTDYTVHGFWIHPHVDYYIIPSDELGFDCLDKGMEEKKIRPLGIPIGRQFTYEWEKSAVREKLGLDGRPVVLVMGGGLGLGAVYQTVKTLLKTNPNLQIVAIAGKNLRLQAQLKELTDKFDHLHVYGYVNNVVEFMSAADLIVTKPGGLTTAEVLAKRLPMVIVDPLPGQEDRNTEFLLNWGVAVKTGQPGSLPALINQLLRNGLRMKHMKEMAGYLAKPDAAAQIADFVMEIMEKN